MGFSALFAEFGNVVFATMNSCEHFPTMSSESVKQFSFKSEYAYTFKI